MESELQVDDWYVDDIHRHSSIYDTPVGSYWANADGTLHPREMLRAVIEPVFAGEPDLANVRALIERFRMLTGELPRYVIVPRIWTDNPRVLLGHNVLLRPG